MAALTLISLHPILLQAFQPLSATLSPFPASLVDQVAAMQQHKTRPSWTRVQLSVVRRDDIDPKGRDVSEVGRSLLVDVPRVIDC